MTTTTLRAYLDELSSLLEREALEETIGHCRHILQHFPKNVETYRVLGRALLERSRPDEARDVFMRVLSAQPDDFTAHLGLSSTYEDVDVNAAIWHLERAFEQEPHNEALHDELRRLLEQRDRSAPSKLQLSQGGLARLYLKSNLYDQAIGELTSALKKAPGRADLAVLLAETYWENGQWLEAGDAALAALDLLPDSLAANRIVAALWIANGRPSDAAPYITQLERLDPFTAWAVAHPAGEPVPASAFLINRLHWDARAAAASAVDVPEWVSSIGDVFDAPQSVALTDAFDYGAENLQSDSSGTFTLPVGISDPLTPSITGQSRMRGKTGMLSAPDEPAANAVPDWFSDFTTPTENAAPFAQPKELSNKAAPADADWLDDLMADKPSAPAVIPNQIVDQVEWLGAEAPPNYEIPLEDPTDNSALDPMAWLHTGPLNAQAAEAMESDLQPVPDDNATLDPMAWLGSGTATTAVDASVWLAPGKGDTGLLPEVSDEAAAQAADAMAWLQTGPLSMPPEMAAPQVETYAEQPPLDPMSWLKSGDTGLLPNLDEPDPLLSAATPSQLPKPSANDLSDFAFQFGDTTDVSNLEQDNTFDPDLHFDAINAASNILPVMGDMDAEGEATSMEDLDTNWMLGIEPSASAAPAAAASSNIEDLDLGWLDTVPSADLPRKKTTGRLNNLDERTTFGDEATPEEKRITQNLPKLPLGQSEADFGLDFADFSDAFATDATSGSAPVLGNLDNFGDLGGLEGLDFSAINFESAEQPDFEQSLQEAIKKQTSSLATPEPAVADVASLLPEIVDDFGWLSGGIEDTDANPLPVQPSAPANTPLADVDLGDFEFALGSALPADEQLDDSTFADPLPSPENDPMAWMSEGSLNWSDMPAEPTAAEDAPDPMAWMSQFNPDAAGSDPTQEAISFDFADFAEQPAFGNADDLAEIEALKFSLPTAEQPTSSPDLADMFNTPASSGKEASMTDVLSWLQTPAEPTTPVSSAPAEDTGLAWLGTGQLAATPTPSSDNWLDSLGSVDAEPAQTETPQFSFSPDPEKRGTGSLISPQMKLTLEDDFLSAFEQEGAASPASDFDFAALLNPTDTPTPIADFGLAQPEMPAPPIAAPTPEPAEPAADVPAQEVPLWKRAVTSRLPNLPARDTSADSLWDEKPAAQSSPSKASNTPDWMSALGDVFGESSDGSIANEAQFQADAEAHFEDLIRQTEANQTKERMPQTADLKPKDSPDWLDAFSPDDLFGDSASANLQPTNPADSDDESPSWLSMGQPASPAADIAAMDFSDFGAPADEASNDVPDWLSAMRPDLAGSKSAPTAQDLDFSSLEGDLGFGSTPPQPNVGTNVAKPNKLADTSSGYEQPRPPKPSAAPSDETSASSDFNFSKEPAWKRKKKS
jgi:Tetratricopeptide repeat